MLRCISKSTKIRFEKKNKKKEICIKIGVSYWWTDEWELLETI